MTAARDFGSQPYEMTPEKTLYPMPIHNEAYLRTIEDYDPKDAVTYKY